MKKYVSCFLIGSLVITMLLTGCGASQPATDPEEPTLKQEAVNGIQYGQILSVSDSEIVLALGSSNQKMPSGDGSEQDRPEKPTDGAVQAPNGGNVPQGGEASGDNTPPDGNTPPQGGSSVDGKAPNGDNPGGQGRSMFELTGDKLTITVSDTTSITYMRAEQDTSDTTASLSDLKEGDIIAVTVDEDGKTALDITIISMEAPGEAPKSTGSNTEE